MFRKISSIVSVVFLIAGCSQAGQKTAGDGKAPNVPHIPVLSAKFHWPQAIEVAQEWHSDAYLIDITVNVRIPGTVSRLNSVYFGFQSPSNVSATLLVKCNQTCYSSEELTTPISLPQCPPLEMDDQLLDSDEALEKALLYGGADHVRSEHALLHMDLERNYPGCDGSTITWSVSFGNITTFENVIYVMDAFSGELLETR